MADNVEDATQEIVRRIQASISEFRAEANASFDRLEAEGRKDRRSINGVMTIVRAVAGDFDERIRC